MSISRRSFLRSATGAGFVLGIGGLPLRGFAGSSSPLLRAAAGNPLRIPPTFSGDTITAMQTAQEIWPGTTTALFSYGGTMPAPTFRVRSGEEFSVRLANQLGERTNIHWHGMMIPPEMDGHPKDTIMPGETFDYKFKIEQRAGTCWYHPHPHGATARQVYLGMAGLFIIEDDEEESLGLPGGDREIPLVIQDRRPTAEGQLIYDHDHMDENDHQNGFLGNTVLVNGTADPYLEVESGLYRFRILNGSNARIYDIAFSDNRTFHIIGTDGGLLDKPYPVTYAYVAPGERLDILVEFRDDEIGSSVAVKSLPFGGSGQELEQGTEMPIIRFDVVRKGGGEVTVPERLAELERVDPAVAARTRLFEMKIDHASTPMGHTINGKTFDMMRIDEEVPLGDMEIWTFRNTSFLPHPMHMHGAQFQVLDRNGSSNLAPTDFGWKDVVFVRPFQEVRVLVRFSQHPGVLLVHCHNLEHEDSGMMLNFAMVDGSAGAISAGRSAPARIDLR